MINLDDPIMKIEGNPWTVRNACEGVQIFGGIGSGKTSGSGRALALKYLKAGYGGLVLTAKPDETDLWTSYCKETGRLDDLCIVRPGGEYSFNFLDYEANREGAGAGQSENIVMVLKTVIKAGNMNGQGSNEAFWDDALDMLLFNVIDLCLLSKKSLDIDDIYAITQTLPFDHTDLKKDGFKAKAFGKTYFDLKDYLRDGKNYASNQDIRKFQSLSFYFWESFIKLNDRTRSVIEHMFWGLLFRLSRDPIYSLFCSKSPNLSPNDSLRGKVIVLDLPVKLYDKVGRDAQILFKYIWQRAMERRDIREDGDKPVFLWADEAQNFIHEHDFAYQATARSSRVCTVYLTQNLPNYYAQLGGREGEYQVKSFMGTLATKVFHSNADHETNKYASELFGEVFKPFPVKSKTMGNEMSVSESYSWIKDSDVPPELFTGLKTGGPANNYKVEAYIHRQGAPWIKGNDKQNYIKTHFTQKHT